MAVQILSDLHLEAPKAYDVFNIIPKAPYLALLGDIGNVALHKDDCLAFLTRQLNQFRARRSQQRSLGDFILLDRAVYRMPDTNVVILGCSLFSSISAENQMAVSLGLNDFLVTNEWDVDSHNEAHERDIAWLNTQVTELEQSDVRIMIFTHWSPSKDARAIDPRHAASSITSAFSTDLSEEKCFQSKKVKIWAFGHTHYNCDFVVERKEGAGLLRLLANQRGYYFAQADGYDGGKTIDIRDSI
ncbi:Uncharacterized protein LHYA1_G005837 [Lachnellula hyalina]|uniref:Calcineurin-like phosphoesterase domain-containing protein n=1 Tax=Lachnellula hyalina TaxID=1316788 RepID=A0A8H8QYP4_9HELO|nr:Uncharacterized protein LHYA1_G005837 [Lachnellula hyalina]TVY24916.1 Uncharacterized protein LHYA1_G005837 [Lachnellula hyalina]